MERYTLSDVLCHFDVVRGPEPYDGGTKYIVRCPTAAHPHGDRNPSAALIVHANGYIEPVCGKGCTAHEIFGAVGLPYPLRVTDGYVEPAPAQQQQRAQRKNTQTAPVTDSPLVNQGENSKPRTNGAPKMRPPGQDWELLRPVEMYALRAHYLGDPIALKYRADWVHKQTGERKKDFTVVWLGQKRPLSELPLYRVRFDRRRAELPHVSVIFEGERKAVWAALLWEHNGRERLHPELAPDAEFFGGYGANVVPTVEAMAATLWSDVVHSDTVVFAPDNDAAGHKWCARMIERAQQAAQAAGKALKLYVLEWTQAPEGGDLADLCERTLIPLPGGRYMLDQDAADPWAEIEVWRAAEWLEAHGFAAPAQEHNTEPATPTLPEWLQGALTLEELEQIAEQEPPVWLPVLGVEGIVCEGDVVLVVGGPKVGKTESGLRIVAGWDMPVLYCTEESRRKWAQRAKKLPACYKNGNVRVVSLYTMATGDEWAQRVRDAAAAGYKVIAIDTMRALVYYQNESDNKQAQLAVGPIAGAARECGVTLVLVHHRNKYSSTEQGTSGGNAIDGLADVILRLEPDRSGNKQRLVLHASGRVIESTDHVLEWSSARELAVVGDVATVRQHELEAIVLEACTDTWESLQEIAARCELQHGSAPGDRALRSTLNKLTDRGALECRESPEHSGKGRPPKQWRRAQYVEPAPAPDMLHVNGRQQYTIPDGW